MCGGLSGDSSTKLRFGDSGVKIRAARDSMTPTPETPTRSGKVNSSRSDIVGLEISSCNIIKKVSCRLSDFVVRT